MPTLYIIAGPNGSGKTTLAKEFIEEDGLFFLNADEIAESINPQDISKAYMQAGREFFKRLNEILIEKKTVIVETTLSGKYHNRVIENFKRNGYEVKLLYIFLESSNLCIDRIRFRVLKGGHSVPNEDIIRRYDRSINNFLNVKTKVSHWILYYNGGEKYIEIAQGYCDNEIILNEEFYSLFTRGNKNG